jgi:hypothetical protein
MRWDLLLPQLLHRNDLPSIRGFLKGKPDDARRLLGVEGIFEVFIVQPGVKRDGRGANISSLLAATRHYLLQSSVERFEVLGS